VAASEHISVVTYDGVDAHPSVNKMHTASATQVAPQSLFSSFIKDDVIRAIAPVRAAKIQQQRKHQLRYAALLKTFTAVLGDLYGRFSRRHLP
jgi:hypothetical protein